MKVAAVAALCVAPLAFASTLEMGLRQRGLLHDRDGILLGSTTTTTTTEQGGKAEKGQGGLKANAGGNNNGQITSITQSSDTTEVILIWVNAGNNAATSTVNSAAAATANAAAATHTVVVGGTQKVFTPDTINAAVGDMVVFEFHTLNHTATTSAFTSPCVANGVFDTGFMANPNDTIIPPPQVGMMVNAATPTWFYCRQKGHCGEGMTFSINPTANKTQADFKALAIQQNGTGIASPIVASASGSVSVATSAAAAPPAASSAVSAAGGSTGLTTGQGVDASGGACTCAVVCAAGSIPNVAAQGVNSFGGMGGSIPAANMAT